MLSAAGEEATDDAADESVDEKAPSIGSASKEGRGETGGVHCFFPDVDKPSSYSSSEEEASFHPLLRGEEGAALMAAVGVVEGGRGASGLAFQGSSKSRRRQNPSRKVVFRMAGVYMCGKAMRFGESLPFCL